MHHARPFSPTDLEFHMSAIFSALAAATVGAATAAASVVLLVTAMTGVDEAPVAQPQSANYGDE